MSLENIYSHSNKKNVQKNIQARKGLGTKNIYSR